MKYTLRQATAADADFLYDLHRATMQQDVDRIRGWDETFQAALFKDSYEPAQSQVIVVDGRDAGVLVVEQQDAALFLARIESLPEEQRRGLGTDIITDVLSQAREAGVSATLKVLKVNPARRLYEQPGFAVTDETTTHYLMPHRTRRKAYEYRTTHF